MNDSFEQEFYDVVSNPDVFTDEKFHNQLEKKTPNKIQDQVHEQLNQSCIEISSWCGEIIKKDVSPDLLSSLRDGTVLCQVANALYSQHPIPSYIQSPQEYMDFNSNLAMFEDHCLEIGISSDLVLDYTLFDDRNVRQ